MENISPDSKQMEYVIKSNFKQEYKGNEFKNKGEEEQKFQEFKDEFIIGFKEAMQPGYNHAFGERFFEGNRCLGVITCNENPSGIAIERNYKESGQLALSEKLYKNKISCVKSSPRDRGRLIGTVYRNLDSSLSEENHNPLARGIMVLGGIGTMNLLGVKYDGNVKEKIKKGIEKGQKPLVAEAVGTLLLRYNMMDTFEGIFGKASEVYEGLSDENKEGKRILTSRNNPKDNLEENILVSGRLINNDLEKKIDEDIPPPPPFNTNLSEWLIPEPREHYEEEDNESMGDDPGCGDNPGCNSPPCETELFEEDFPPQPPF